ncbi:alpha-1,2-fucosyltransferase [Neomicrococcus aestuarii]|uniref:Alpha-1,2-fucosyltransferase n=1 Tax=Neomicrococcus aestuarii TaxID=556325 RepID=A0A1L2ZMV1_9MICC|nr:alpha-1,2-fucosyltransferase [Neomicrococcus aestuarii]APF40446.1 hypothetical protein BHE16_04790 [Neomicrococcus aestuarii]
MSLIHTLSAPVLSLLRRGENGVIWSADGKRGGNYLYVWMRADRNLSKGKRTPFLYRKNMEDWLIEFPALRDLTIEPQHVAFWMPRFSEWPISYGVDFSEEDLAAFIEKRLLASSTFSRRVAEASKNVDSGALTINVRRGDYYSPEFEDTYGMDIRAYVSDALASFDNITSIRVISDDLSWCKDNLDVIPKSIPKHFGGVVPGPFGDLATLAVSRNLILPNSTFSYWGGFLSDYLSQRTNRVVVPQIHERYDDGDRFWPLPDRWMRVATERSSR